MKSIFYKIIYQSWINFILRNINKLLHPYLLKFQIHPSGRLKVKLSKSANIKFHTNQTDFVAFCLFWNGYRNYEYLELFEQIIRQCRGFIDIGTNAGFFSLLATKVNANLRVLAIDPSSAAAYYVPKNLKANHVAHQVKFTNCAASNTNAPMTFYEVTNPKYPYLKYNLGGASSLYEKPTNFREINVEAVQLDSLTLDQKFDCPIDFVKIDAEGAEPHIIKGMDHIIRNDQPIIVCELLYGLIEKELESVFNLYEYIFYFHTRNGLVQHNSLVRSEDDGVRNCFFVPHSKQWLINQWVVDA